MCHVKFFALFLGVVAASTCPYGYHSSSDCPGMGTGLRGDIDSPSLKDCETRCSLKAKCDSFEWNQEGEYCNLNVANCATGKHFDHDIECQKSCPQGYHSTTDCPGFGTGLAGRIKVRDMALCQALCDSDDRCDSFEFSPTEKYCNLNVKNCATGKLFVDYLNCAKGPEGLPPVVLGVKFKYTPYDLWPRTMCAVAAVLSLTMFAVISRTMRKGHSAWNTPLLMDA